MAKDKYSLPEGDTCYSTLEAYKHYTADATEDVVRAFWYREYGGRIEQWRQCCPELQERVDKLRPAKLDVEALKKITLPAAIATQESPCFKYLQFNAAAPASPWGRPGSSTARRSATAILRAVLRAGH